MKTLHVNSGCNLGITFVVFFCNFRFMCVPEKNSVNVSVNVPLFHRVCDLTNMTLLILVVKHVSCLLGALMMVACIGW